MSRFLVSLVQVKRTDFPMPAKFTKIFDVDGLLRDKWLVVLDFRFVNLGGDVAEINA